MTQPRLMALIMAYGRACADEEMAYAAGIGDREERAVAEKKRLIGLMKTALDELTEGKQA